MGDLVTHQATVARRLMDGLHTVTGNSNHVLVRRPFFVFWFMAQMIRSVRYLAIQCSSLPI